METSFSVALRKEQTGADDRYLGAARFNSENAIADGTIRATVRFTVPDVEADGTEAFHIEALGLGVNSFSFRGYIMFELKG